MNREKIIKDIYKIMQEMIDMLDERNLLYLKQELEKMCISIKCVIELKEKLEGEE